MSRYNRELADLSDDLRPRISDLVDAAAAAGHALSITSAWRSRAEQQRLYDGWKARKPGFNPANPPGRSKHENTTADGRPAADACDLDYPNGEKARAEAVAWTHQHAARFGVHFPIRREDWHAESDGTRYSPTRAKEDVMTPAQEKKLDRVIDLLEALIAPRRADKQDQDTSRLSLGDIVTKIEQAK